MPSKVLETFRMHIVGSNVLPPSLKKLFEENKNFVTFHGQLSDEKVRHEGARAFRGCCCSLLELLLEPVACLCCGDRSACCCCVGAAAVE